MVAVWDTMFPGAAAVSVWERLTAAVVLPSVVTTMYVYTPALAVISSRPSRMDPVMGRRAASTMRPGATWAGERYCLTFPDSQSAEVA
ncbi:hypothetical protein ABZ565_03640 [Streptomyces sp. NPDC016469]|uniref:hypothetical protein n=1 Tax=Streptomyces sp. NPDC016469 TaxID=3157191 RepID=UPI0033F13329